MKPPSGTLSVWASAAQIPLGQTLQENVRADVCIVGAGIAGMTTADLLTRAAASAGKDQGATFVVRLPVSPVYHFDEAEGRIHPGTQHLLMPLDQSERLDEMKLLIVDDEQDTRDLLQTALSRVRSDHDRCGISRRGLSVIN